MNIIKRESLHEKYLIYSSKIYLFFIFLLFTSYSYSQESLNLEHGTAAFIIRTPKQIVVAVDSRAVDANYNITSDSVCKIGKFGTMYYVVNGLSSQSNVFNVFHLLQKAQECKGSVYDKINSFEQLVKAPLVKALTNLKNDTATFNEVTKSRSQLGVNFFGIRNDTLVLINRGFKMIDDKDSIDLDIERNECPGNCDSIAYILVGSNEFNNRFSLRYPRFWERNLVEMAKTYVQMQIDEKVPAVGGEIQTIQITLNSTNWSAKNNCK
ncbi:MAG: hypothetical protein J7502_09090 [Flavisolibacter sp.]|nr:hypothetical protein [Flavisolibacter sp.]